MKIDNSDTSAPEKNTAHLFTAITQINSTYSARDKVIYRYSTIETYRYNQRTKLTEKYE